MTPGVPWLCRRHRQAGLAAEPPCCDGVTSAAGASNAWFSLRLAARAPRERAAILRTIDDPRWARGVLSVHARRRGRAWAALRAYLTDDDDLTPRPTLRLRLR